MKTTVVKIVRKAEDGTRRSAIICNCEAETVYKINRDTIPKAGKLLAFAPRILRWCSRWQLWLFKLGMKSAEIRLAEASNVKEESELLMVINSQLSLSRIRSFWGKNGHKTNWLIRFLRWNVTPEFTVSCSSLRLIKRIG